MFPSSPEKYNPEKSKGKMIGRMRGGKAKAGAASHPDVDIFFKLHVVTWSNPFYSLFDQMR
jgi:hypothetical protein